VASSFQTAVSVVIAARAAHALHMARKKHPELDLLVVAGGVAANGAVRRALSEMAERESARLLAPPLRLCTDNAVMVAWCAIERLRAGLSDRLDAAPRPRWPL